MAERADALRYRLLRVELTELRDALRARATPVFVWPDQLADQIQRMLDRAADAGQDRRG